MKLIASTLVALFAASLIVGCEASGRVDTYSTPDNSHTTYKKTTIEHPNGDTTVKTEKQTTTY